MFDAERGKKTEDGKIVFLKLLLTDFGQSTLNKAHVIEMTKTCTVAFMKARLWFNKAAHGRPSIKWTP